MNPLFVYGTLMLKEVRDAVLKKSVETTEIKCVLKDYIRLAVRGHPYPAIIPRKGERVEGILLFGISQADLAVLDTFEGTEYVRKPTIVQTQDGKCHEAWAYFWHDPNGMNLGGAWSLIEEHLDIDRLIREID